MIHIGTSGWHYRHWRCVFYPEKLPASKMLDFYAQHFDTVELNNTFYRLPPVNGLENWRERTPGDFCFAAKGSRFITHMKKLKDPEVAIGRYFERVDRLQPKLGAIVFQLPPSWEADAGRLEEFSPGPAKTPSLCVRAAQPHVAYGADLQNPAQAQRCLLHFRIAGVAPEAPAAPTRAALASEAEALGRPNREVAQAAEVDLHLL